MKAQLCLFIFLALAINSATSQVLRAFSPRYYNPSVRGNIVYVSNNIISSASGNTSETPPSGTSDNYGVTGINVDVDVPSPTTYIGFGSIWKYLDNNTRPNNWHTSGYNDGAWSSGPAEFGYGDGDEETVVSYGGNSNIRYITTYFRKSINIPNPSAHPGFTMSIKYDDAFVVYVNGVEVRRANITNGNIGHNTTASSSVENVTTSFSLASSVFTAGTNVIAVEIHNRSNNNNDISFDLELTGSNDNTFNSSSSDLNLSSCSQILWAGLYWGAGQGDNGGATSWKAGATTCLLKLPGTSSYTTINSTQTDYYDNTIIANYMHSGFNCFADITSLINAANPNGTYTVANIASPAGYDNAFGGWTIVVVYSNPALPVRNLTVFDGSAGVDGVGSGSNVDVSISGFLTPPTGLVSCELGAVVYDGDRGYADAFSFRQSGAAGFYNLTPNPTANTNDMWNSTIAYKGAVVTTRNPAHRNTMGYDANIIDLPNTSNAQLGNSKTGATVRFSSPSENYIVQVLTTSITQYNPSFSIIKSSSDINGGSLLGGDTLRYQVSYRNVGNDASTASVIYDNIPPGTSFVPGSLKISGVAKTDAPGDDQAEYDYVNNRVVFRLGTGANGSSGGVVPTGGLGNISFEVAVSSSCIVQACTAPISNRAAIQYAGETSLQSLYDSSGITVSGCTVPEPDVRSIDGGCYSPSDTILINNCPSTAVTLPVTKYAGYSFYSAKPFTSATLFNPATPITSTRILWAYFEAAPGCSDTIQINVYIMACPDIDDDNDGIPDFVEINMPAAVQDSDNDGIPNWKDSDYFNYIDNNLDGFNDNFDPGADSDNDGIVNFLDADFPGFIDNNGDGINDNMDKDLDGIPNNLDLDSDNDGIPDTVESFGVDANGDGRIDNYTETDNDGFSQNVDANNTGVAGSGNGLGGVDTDGDGVPNFLDLDSDNDGISDIAEVYGADNNHDGKIDNYIDNDGDGFADSIDGDVGNDGVAENSASALLRTGADGNNNGRADSFPFKNMDGDNRPNPYDLDSDGDSITDVREAGFMDSDNNGQVDGFINSNGWNSSIASSGILTLPNTDNSGPPNVYDIDSDDDGIPDGIEAPLTTSYVLPSGADTDGDGIDNAYDNIPGFGGNGISPIDTDVDNIPDYMDQDTDSDGIKDLYEGNDLNLNGSRDDNIIVTESDADGDGLDDFFDNAPLSAKGTSRYMGNNGSTNGDNSAGSITTVQRTASGGCPVERDWRCVNYLLSHKEEEKDLTSRQERLYSNTVQIAPNPVKGQLKVIVNAVKPLKADLMIIDFTGRKLMSFKENIKSGTNMLTYQSAGNLPAGIYYLHVKLGETVKTYKFTLIK